MGVGSGDGDARFRLWGGAGGTYYPWPGQFLFTGKATIENANCGWRAPDSTRKLHKQLEVVILRGKCKLEKLIQLSLNLELIHQAWRQISNSLVVHFMKLPKTQSLMKL